MTEAETKLLDLIAARTSDRQIRITLGLDQSALVRLGESVRGKLGIAPGASIRDALHAPAGGAS